MRKTLLSCLALAALLALPGSSQAKERGCAYRLAGLSEARVDVDRALRTKRGLAAAEAKLTRARIKAAEEGCFIGARDRRDFRTFREIDRRDFRDRKFEKRDFRDRRFEERRFDKRDFRDRRLDERRRWREARLAKQLRIERRRDFFRFKKLQRIRDYRRLTRFERRELRRIKRRWGF